MEKVNSPFCTTAEKTAISNFDQEYVSYLCVEKVKEGFDPTKPHDFLIEQEYIEDERIPIKEEINAHRSRVGLKNLLKGIVSSKQMSDLIERTGSAGGYIDATRLPDSHLAIEKLAGSIDKIWADIPDELKGDLTKEEFISSINAEKVKKYALSQVQKKIEAEAGKD